MLDQIARGARQVAFCDMPRDHRRVGQSEDRRTGLASTRQGRSGRDGHERITDHRAPPVKRREVLSPVLSCEFLVSCPHFRSIAQPRLRRYPRAFVCKQSAGEFGDFLGDVAARLLFPPFTARRGVKQLSLE